MSAEHTSTSLREYLATVSNRNFALLWLGQWASMIGDAVYEVALVWLTLEVSGRAPEAVGIVIFARAAPFLLVGLPAGALADVWDKRTTMIVCDVLRALVVLAVPLLSRSVSMSVWHIAAIAFVLTAVRALFQPCLQASIPLIVPRERIDAANVLVNTSLQISLIAGPVVAGFALTFISPERLFAADGVTFLVSAVSLWLVRMPATVRREPPTLRSVSRDVIGGIRALRAYATIRWVVLLFGVGLLFIAGTQRVGLPILADQRLAGASSFGLLVGTMGLGTILGGYLVGALALRYGIMIFAGWLLWGVSFGALGLSTDMVVILPLALLAGATQGVINVGIVSLLQKSLDPTVLGRAFGVWLTSANVGDSVSGLMTGIALANLSIVAVFAMSGGVTALVGVTGLVLVLRVSRDRQSGGPVTLSRTA